MSSSEPLAGIIVPCFNQGHFAAQCIESIRAQTCRNWRVVIVDDASTDGSAAHLAALAGNGVEIVTLTENVGLPAARNVALKRLDDVDYVLTIDCDDWVSPDYLERLVAAIHSDPRVGLAHPTLKLFGVPHPLGIETWPASELVYEERYVENRVPGCSIMRASILRRLGGWNDAFRHSGAADWDLWLRIVESGWRLVWVRDAIYHYRQHAESMVATTSENGWRSIATCFAFTPRRSPHRSARSDFSPNV
jgi:glycosyltransferase involved in cell wall biosynthesis